MTVTAGSPTVTVSAAAVVGDYADASATITAGVPTVAASAAGQDINANTAATVTAGTPTVTAAGNAETVVNADTAALITAGSPTVTATADTTTGGTVPGAPTMLQATDITGTGFLLEWQAGDNGGLPITGYEIRLGSDPWTALAATTRLHRFTGLTAGAAHTAAVRAINSLGTGPEATLSVVTVIVAAPGVPRSVSAQPTGERSISLGWQVPLFDGGTPITGYEVCVVDAFGAVQPFEPTGAGTRATVRGLAFGQRYGFQVRAVNTAGSGSQSPLVDAVPAPVSVLMVPSGDPLPLIDTDRQSFIVRLAGVDCRVRVRWQPSDLAWYADLEVPVNTPVVSGRRLTVDSGLLGMRPGVLSGDLVVRALDDSDEGVDPVRDAWERGSHGIVWEPA